MMENSNNREKSEIVKNGNVFETGNGLKMLVLNLIESGVVSGNNHLDDIPYYGILNGLKDYGSDQFNWFQLSRQVKDNVKTAYVSASIEYRLSKNLA